MVWPVFSYTPLPEVVGRPIFSTNGAILSVGNSWPPNSSDLSTPGHKLGSGVA